VNGAGALVRNKPVEVIGVGVCSAAVPSVLIIVGEHHVQTGLSSLLLSSTPLWIAVGSHVLLPSERLRLHQALCLVPAVCGTALLAVEGGQAGGMLPWSALLLLAAVSYAAGNLLVRGRLRQADPFTLTCVQMGVATVVSAPFAAAHAGSIRWQTGPWLAVATLGVMCSGLGWLANTVLLQRVSAVRASLVSFAAPVVAVLLGAIVLRERLSLMRLASAGMVLAAIATFGLLTRSTIRPSRYREVRAVLELAILGFLAEESMHAYELRGRLTVLLGHVRPVSDGALYPALKRLQQHKLVARRPEPGSSGPPRQVFELTGAGRADLHRRLTEPSELDITDRNKYFVVLAFLHLLPSRQAQAEVLRRRLDFLRDPERGFFVANGHSLRRTELSSPFRVGIQQIARATSSAEQKWLATTLNAIRAELPATD
jgi:drug/metabolite transporter (DMT)-like permease/DNA-binding PadR family transcriptional regulator